MALSPQQERLFRYCLHLADDALIMSQRLSEWTGHGPALEQDIALTNIALDCLGQARNYYQFAATLAGDNATEDSLAYLRRERDYLNHLLVELPNGDWGQTIAKLFLFAAYQQPLLNQLAHCPVEDIAAIAGKAIKENKYHLKWSSEWMMRLGDGTSESHRRMQRAIDYLWNYTGELYTVPPYDISSVNYELVQDDWMATVQDVFTAATLSIPNTAPFQSKGINGIHTEYMGYLLADLQYMQRAYPDSVW